MNAKNTSPTAILFVFALLFLLGTAALSVFPVTGLEDLLVASLTVGPWFLILTMVSLYRRGLKSGKMPMYRLVTSFLAAVAYTLLAYGYLQVLEFPDTGREIFRHGASAFLLSAHAALLFTAAARGLKFFETPAQ